MNLKSFLRDNIPIMLLMNSGNVFTYLFQVLAARSLSPDDYGAFNALNSILLLVGAPMIVLTLVFSRFTIHYQGQGMGQVREFIWLSLRWMVLGALGLMLVGLVASPLLRDLVKLSSLTPSMIMIAQCAVSLILVAPLGFLQGLQHFSLFGALKSLPTFIRLLCGVAFFSLGAQLNGALLSGLLANLLSVGIGLALLTKLGRGSREPLPPGSLRGVITYAVPVLFTTLFTLTLGNLDIVLVRYFCQPQESGMYASAAILGRIGYILPATMAQVLFPAAARNHCQGDSRRSELWWSIGATTLIASLFALGCHLWPEFIIRVMLGAKYQEGAHILRLISIAMGMFSISNVLFTFCMAQCRNGFIWILGSGVGLLVLLVFLYHETPEQIAALLLGTSAAILGATLVWFFWSDRKTQQESHA